MHWFDDLAKTLAAKNVPRKSALASIARVAATAAVFPWASTATAALAQPVSSTRRTAGVPASRMRPVRGVPTLAPTVLPSTTRVGPCTHRFAGSGNALTYSASSTAGGRMLQLTIEQQMVVERAGSAAHVGGTSTIAVTSGGEPVARIEANFRPAAANAPPSGTVAVRYGAFVRGLRDATLTVEHGTIAGPGGDAHASPHVEIDPALREGVAALFARARTELGTCGAAASRPLPRERQSHRELTRAVHRERTAIAQTSPDYPRTTDQNGIGRDGSGTPDCHTCTQNLMVSWAECMVGAAATGWLCPPCAVGAVAGCYSSMVAGGIGCLIPTVGGCAEVICPSLGTCDHGYTCCGDICCASGDVCTNGVCCPGDNPLGCGQPRPTCCAPGATCCGDSCCPAGSVCSSDGTCFTCPAGQTNCGGTACCAAGQICHNGKCCDFLCGDDCCVSGEVCNHQSQTCGYGGVCGGQFCTFTQACVNGRCVNVATPAPSPKPQSKFLHCRAGFAVCNSPNPDGSVTSICCPSNMQCCNGVCCTAPNETCCARGGALGCNVCIR
jgi:hypothetical protein